MNRNELVKRIELALKSEISLAPIAMAVARKISKDIGSMGSNGSSGSIRQSTERVINTPIPGTGPRVMYVAIPGRGKNREELSKRAAQVLAMVERHKQVTAKKLQSALRVNRNVIAGAVHELKQAGLLRSQASEVRALAGGRTIQSAAEFKPASNGGSRASAKR